nr:RagB/SusD family nutrient uptake outer membrane protein [Niabella hibiscisoli]
MERLLCTRFKYTYGLKRRRHIGCGFFQGTRPSPGVSGVTYVDVSARIGAAVNSQLLKNGTSGELTWMNEIPRKWNERNYYYPIPLNDLQRNPNLKQNPGWE